MEVCQICNRSLGELLIEKHHLIPKTFGGKETISIHKICHQKIHATFSERELQHIYNTPAVIIQHEQIQKFVKWIKNKSSDFYDKNDDTSARHKKRR